MWRGVVGNDLARLTGETITHAVSAALRARWHATQMQ